MILSLEPLESLRYLEYLNPAGRLVTSTDPTENMDDYPDRDVLLEKIGSLPNAVLVDAEALARRERNLRGVNMVMVGAASHWLPLKPETLRRFIERRFAAKGAQVVEANLRLFDAGREAAHAAQPVASR
jgi:indolepyruvate ferredoxin oxidoreductase, beta subunit